MFIERQHQHIIPVLEHEINVLVKKRVELYRSYEIAYTLNGLYHNPNGPAIILVVNDGTRQLTWCKHGRQHRTDGPSFMSSETNGKEYSKEYSLEDNPLTEEEFIIHYEFAFLKEYVEPPCEDHWFL